VATLNSARRVYLHKRVIARRAKSGLEPAWQAKQEEMGGTDLPGSFPRLAALSAVGYTTEEDLDGADAAELVDYVGLSSSDADAVIAAFAAL
jgi:hypothetical protein